jgi:hypothetical protein
LLRKSEGVLDFQDPELLAGCCHDHAHFPRADALVYSILLDLYNRLQVWIRRLGSCLKDPG